MEFWSKSGVALGHTAFVTDLQGIITTRALAGCRVVGGALGGGWIVGLGCMVCVWGNE